MRAEFTAYFLKGASLLLVALPLALMWMLISEALSYEGSGKSYWVFMPVLMIIDISITIYLFYLSSLLWRSRIEQFKTNIIVTCSVILYFILLRVGRFFDFSEYPSPLSLVIAITTLILPFIICRGFYIQATKLLFPHVKTKKNC